MKPDATLQSILTHIAEDRIPPEEINLTAVVRSRIAGDRYSPPTRLSRSRIKRRGIRNIQYAMVGSLLTVVLLVILLITPQGRVWAQELLHFFTHAESDALPVQPWQLTPQSTLASDIASPDPANILEAKLSVNEVEEQIGFDVKEPTWLPDRLSLVGATFDPLRSLVRIFYRLEESNGLVLKEEFYSSYDTCALCTEVGASASVETVQIGSATGEYVQGVWKLTEKGPIWENDPYLQTLRWQADGVAYELQYMGPADTLSRDDLVKIASNLQ